MNIGFFVENTGKPSLIHFEVAKAMLESVRKVMPGVQVFQLTDSGSPIVPGVDGVKRIGGSLPMAMRRMTHHSRLEGDWLFVDSDILFLKDVRPVFDEEFDVALTDRIGTSMEGTPYAKQMPYNMGVTFSRSPKFWRDVVEALPDLPRRLQQWEGDQRIVCEMAAQNEEMKLGYNIKILPGRIYNFPPDPGDDTEHASILHCKGNLKAMMLKQEVEVSEWER